MLLLRYNNLSATVSTTSQANSSELHQVLNLQMVQISTNSHVEIVQRQLLRRQEYGRLEKIDFVLRCCVSKGFAFARMSSTKEVIAGSGTL